MTKSISTISLLLLSVLLTNTFAQTPNNFPLVGIITIPAEGWDGWEATSWNYIAASYVKFLESAGAQVVPVHWDLPNDQLDALLSQLNGILFTGGGTDFGNATNPAPVWYASQHIINWVLQTNQNGTYYPMWGTCQGFETISRVLANNMTLFTPCDGCVYVNTNNYPVPTYNSKLLATLPQDLQQKITYGNLSLFDHVNKLDIAAFAENPTLSGNVSMVAYSIDQNQTTYVSMYESRIYPIYAVQFHQEKSTFEWKPSLNINHEYDSIRFEQYLSNFLVQEARKNNNTFPNNASALIYNWNSTGVPDSTFTEVYFFPVYNGTHKRTSDDVNFVPNEEEQGDFLGDVIADEAKEAKEEEERIKLNQDMEILVEPFLRDHIQFLGV